LLGGESSGGRGGGKESLFYETGIGKSVRRKAEGAGVGVDKLTGTEPIQRTREMKSSEKRWGIAKALAKDLSRGQNS